MERRTRVSVYEGGRREGERGGITPETTENINQVNFTGGCTRFSESVERESTNMGRVRSLFSCLSSSFPTES